MPEELALVSVVIPCYNPLPYLEETLASVLNQNYINLEVILIDDGSSDNFYDVIKKNADDRIQYFRQSNQGVSSARNLGMSKVSGEFILFLDADDVLGEGFIATKVSFLQHNIEYGAVGSFIECIGADSNAIGSEFLSVTSMDDIVQFKPNTATCPSSYIFRKSVLEKSDLKFHTALQSSADKFFILSFLQHSKIALSTTGGKMKYRVHTHSMSNKNHRSLALDQLKYLNLVKTDKNLKNKLSSAFLSRLCYTISALYHSSGGHAYAIQYTLRSLFISPTTFFKLKFLQ